MISIPVSHGEFYDKITILRIKRARLHDPEKRANVEAELALLEGMEATLPSAEGLDVLVAQLQDVNERLWDVEDGKRRHERMQDFGPGFIALARQVYMDNDRRAAIKREINIITRSDLVEEKSHDLPGSP